MTIDEKYMHRCLQLAQLGAGHVAPNPMVGALLVQDNRIIGEGWHQQYGQAHAEVNAIGQATLAGRHAGGTTLYVSLEPCAHFGKTPPCTDLIISKGIPKVVIGCRDPFDKVNGKGIEKLQAAGIEVVTGVLETRCEEVNKRFFTFHRGQRPYVILKWAETADQYLASGTADRLMISNACSNRLVHKWRSEEAAVMVGTNTALLDDPELTTRLWPGPSPIRLVVDMELKLPSKLKLFDQRVRTIVFNGARHEEDGNILYYRLLSGAGLVPQLMKALHRLNIQSVMVEGGARLLQAFIGSGIWDEARIVVNGEKRAGSGLSAPALVNAKKTAEEDLGTDKVGYYKNLSPTIDY